MGLSDKLKTLSDKAKESAAEHREQITGAVETAGMIADKRTRGRYSDKIAKVTSKTESAVERFAGQENDDAAVPPTGEATPTSPTTPATPTAPPATPPPPPVTPPARASRRAPAEPPLRRGSPIVGWAGAPGARRRGAAAPACPRRPADRRRSGRC